jgi:hypothetical protein
MQKSPGVMHPFAEIKRIQLHMAFQKVTIKPVMGDDGTAQFALIVTGPEGRSSYGLHETLEGAIESFNPPLTARVRSHIVETVHQGKAVDFSLEDALDVVDSPDPRDKAA